MLHFDCDYMEGVHPKILEKLIETNMLQMPGYGNDLFCTQAKEKIRQACACPDAEIHFMVGGTQTNATIISAMLRTYEGVVAVETGHINVHEAGAVEASGHKVLTVKGENGKMSKETLDLYLSRFYEDENHAHMVWPGMVYISYPTEYGTIYSKAELKGLHEVCQKYALPLFVDGARLGYGLMSPKSDLTLPELAQSCDVFYIGGTKVGALFGEAVVFPKPGIVPNFFTIIKQKGALLAKGRALGIQFETLFEDALYFKISKHAIEQAMRIKQGFLERGYPLFMDSYTNQQFVILSPGQLEHIQQLATCEIWETLEDGRIVVRFATSWATKPEDVDCLLAYI